MKIRYGLALLAAGLLFAGAATSHAETGFSAHLDGLQEASPNASPATGYATVVLNNAQNSIHVHLEFSGLTSAQTGAHIHGPAGPGVPAGVIFPLSLGSPVEADFAITATQVGYLNDGLLYINVHTTNFSAGEIRGQFAFDPTPTENATWSRIKTLYR